MNVNDLHKLATQLYYFIRGKMAKEKLLVLSQSNFRSLSNKQQTKTEEETKKKTFQT